MAPSPITAPRNTPKWAEFDGIVKKNRLFRRLDRGQPPLLNFAGYLAKDAIIPEQTSFRSINQFSLRTEFRLNLRSPSHYVKMLLAIHQIERKRGKQNNQMQQSTAITRDKVLRVYVTNVYAKIILSVQRYNDASNSQSIAIATGIPALPGASTRPAPIFTGSIRLRKSALSPAIDRR
jgi:hypothetical protein